jgi:hypothetical protein
VIVDHETIVVVDDTTALRVQVGDGRYGGKFVSEEITCLLVEFVEGVLKSLLGFGSESRRDGR